MVELGDEVVTMRAAIASSDWASVKACMRNLNQAKYSSIADFQDELNVSQSVLVVPVTAPLTPRARARDN
jgi:hypothetical protein